MNPMYPGLPRDLEDDWVEAMATGEISASLANFLDKTPGARSELEALGDVAEALRADRDAAHPGAHYFDALEGDILAQLPTNGPAPLVGKRVSEEKAASGWSSAWAWLTRRPTLAWAAVMVAALLAILAWPRLDEPSEPVVVEADAGAAEPDRADWLAAALPQSLTQTEIHELRQVAADIRMGGLDEPSDGLDDDWGLGMGTAAIVDMGDDELDSVEDALEAPL